MEKWFRQTWQNYFPEAVAVEVVPDNAAVELAGTDSSAEAADNPVGIPADLERPVDHSEDF